MLIAPGGPRRSACSSWRRSSMRGDHARVRGRPSSSETVELTRIMLLSPIFLALGAVATSVLNAGGRFAAVGHRPDRLQPRDHRRARSSSARPFGVEGLAIGVVAGSLGHLLVQLRPLRAARASATRRGSSGSDPQARKALVLMAPRAIGLGATPDHVHRRDGPRVDARRRAPWRTSTSPSRCSRSRSGSSASRSASSSCRRCRATRRSGARPAFADAADAGPAPARLRDGPDRGADRGRCGSRSSRSAVRRRPDRRRRTST